LKKGRHIGADKRLSHPLSAHFQTGFSAYPSAGCTSMGKAMLRQATVFLFWFPENGGIERA
jgi:hypothetical protein